MVNMGNNLPFKVSEKLPRGSYFYIKVGHRFYAGEEPVFETVKSEPTLSSPITYFQKDGSHTKEFTEYRKMHHRLAVSKKGPRGRREARDRRKASLPSYSIPKKKQIVLNKRMTGEMIIKLSDQFDEVKKFRCKKAAQNACEKIKRTYGSLVDKIQIQYFQGETL